MLIYGPDLPGPQRTKVENAVQLIKQELSTPSVPMSFPMNLHRDLDEMVAGHGTNPSMAIAPYAVIGYDPRPDGPWGYAGGACVWLTERVFAAGERRLAAVLLHELVHVLCGRELDSEVSEFRYFSDVATLNQGDINSFRQANWRGRWFRVVEKQGKAFVKHDWGEIELPISPALVNQYDLPTQ